MITTLLLSFNSPSKSGPNYTQQAQSCLGNKGGMAHVVTACTTLMNGVDVSPENRNKLLRSRGWAYYSGKQYDKAILDYTSALALFPNDPQSTLWRANAYDAAGDVQSAETAYEKALSLAPSSTEALFHKAQFDRDQGNTSAAIQGMEWVLELDPSYGRAGTVLINTHYDVNGHDAVEQFLAQAEQRWPDQTWVYSARLIYDLNVTGDHESALTASATLARLEPGENYDLFMPAMIHLKIGDEDKGIEFVNEYADYAVQRDLAELAFYKRWYRKTSNWYALGQDEEWLHRYTLLAAFGRPDLAMSVLQGFLEETGENGRYILILVMRRFGTSVPREADAGSVEHLNAAIADYLGQFEKQSGFMANGLPEEVAPVMTLTTGAQ
ncbi:tetratricopeptide repeat protein [Ruegeria sp. A3M17]|uniref:tetratricopeptide repeat protein n=1 Tax=Ruegeria sp. A3M17 TaxID=2267229 RepID=UPI0013146AD1|nr:tetratricopeptide repeat protein [Ruegeria sp. A3M17]